MAHSQTPTKYYSGKLRCNGMPSQSLFANAITLTSITVSSLLFGCTSTNKPANTLYIAYPLPENEFNRSLKERSESQIKIHTQLFKQTNPDTRVVTVAYKANKMKKQITEDSRLNLGPDLIISDTLNLQLYYQDSLVSSFPSSPPWTQQYDDVIKGLSTINEKLVGAPFAITPQVACYNNKVVKQPPKTIQELVELGASGIRIGLATNPSDIFWTAGSTGAIQEISSLITKQNKNKQPLKIKEWLTWLRQAAYYQNISFYSNQSQLSNELTSNNLDWISCSSFQASIIKEKMGEQLSITILPNGVQTKAFTWPYITAFGLGTNSSPTQRSLALSYVKSNTNAVGQRQLMLRDEVQLPANKNVDIPNESSKTLKALNDSWNEQSLSYLEEWPMIIQYLSTSQNYLDVKRTLAKLTSGVLSVEEAEQILINLAKEDNK